MAKKIPSNFYQEVNVRKLNNVFDSGLPSIGSDDNGKVVKVVENKFALSEDLHTTVVANPETGTASEELENLKIGDTIYSVNKPSFEYIKGIRLTISDGGQYRTDKPKVEFYDDGGNLVTTPTYTSSCNKEYQGNISLNQVCSIATTDAPGIFTYVFDTTMPVTINHLIKLTNAGAFAGDIAKSVKVELTADGENWLELWFDPSIAWSGSSNAYRIIDIKTGEVSNTLLPIVTSADNGKVLGVVNGVWDKMDVPPDVYHVGDEFTHNPNICDVFTAVKDGDKLVIAYMVILDKKVSSDVKWASVKINDTGKMFIYNASGTLLASNILFTDHFNINASMSGVKSNAITLFLHQKNDSSLDFSSLTTGQPIFIKCTNTFVFEANKPT